MRKIAVLFTLLMVALSPALVAAQTQDTEASGSGAQALTRIEADSEAHEIRFYLEGSLAAVLKSDGLHVREGVSYGGALTDYGRKGFDNFGDDAKPGKGEADAD